MCFLNLRSTKTRTDRSLLEEELEGPSMNLESGTVRNGLSLAYFAALFFFLQGGAQFGSHMFVVVYDKKLGCRWYNTQTGQIGGQWGTTGAATVATPYFIRHANLSRSGKYVFIIVDWFGWYVWDLSTLTVSACPTNSNLDQCAGYGAVGYNSLVNSPAMLGDTQTVKRPFSNISTISQLVWPIAYNWGQNRHFT